MKLLVDMNLAPRWAQALAAAGHDAVHWRDVGAANSSDKAIMEYAKLGGYVVLTCDLDFGDILAATGGDSPSVVLIRSDDVTVDAALAPVLRGIQSCAEHLARGALVSIDLHRARVRMLPLPQTR